LSGNNNVKLQVVHSAGILFGQWEAGTWALGLTDRRKQDRIQAKC